MDAYINVKNFGPIEAAEIDLRPLTVFVGESNTGKTYLAALIYALHKHFEGFPQLPWADYIPSYFRYFYRTRKHYSQNPQEKLEQEIDILEKLNTPDRPFKYSDLPEQVTIRSESRLTDEEDFPDELIRCFDHESVSKLIRFTGDRADEMKVALSVHGKDQTCWDFEVRSIRSAEPIINGHINPELILFDANDAERKTEFQELSDAERLFRTLGARRLRSENSYYLPAARSGIMQSRNVLAAAFIRRSTRIGLDRLPEVSTFSGMIGDFLEQIFDYKERNGTPSKISSVAEQLETELLEGKIEVKRSKTEAYPEFLYRLNQSEETLRMSHSSAMVSELAPLVLYLRGIVKQGDMLIIEEPESHLHPGAQTIIAQTLARLVRAGVRVLITTHSNYLLQQISNLIREGELQKQGESTNDTEDYLKVEEVGAWRFYKDKPVEELPFDLVEGIEPEDHLDIAEDLYNRSAGLQNRIQQKKGEDTIESE